MTLFNYNNNPSFPDRYTRDKGWVRVLPIAGRPLQTAEVTEMQSILHDNLRQGMASIHKNGTPLEGLRASIGSTTNGSSQVIITSGSIYVEGVVLEVQGKTVVVPNTGEHTVGVLVEESIITEEDDSSLRDPITGGSLYGMEGAARLVWRASIVLNEEGSYPIATISQGQVLQRELNPFYSVEEALARYTFERSGNFKVRGFDVVHSRFIAGLPNLSLYQDSLQERDSLIEEVKERQDRVNLATARLENLEVDLESALLNTDENPINATRTFIEDLEDRIEEARVRLATVNQELIDSQVRLASSISRTDDLLSLTSDREVLSISPGVAYVEGYRVSKPGDTIIEIPKLLAEEEVRGAKYQYLGKRASITRTLSLGTASTIKQVKEASTVIMLAFDNIPYEESLIPIRARFTISLELTSINSLEDLVSFIVYELSNPTIPNRAVSFSTRSTLSIPQQILKELLRRAISFSISGSTSIVISSRSEPITPIRVTLSISNPSLSTETPTAQLSSQGSINSYQLGFRPVARVDRLIADMEALEDPITRGPNRGTQDRLNDDTVFRIRSITQGRTTFMEGRDYRLVGGHLIDWSLSGEGHIEPEPGSTYLVTYLYTREMVRDRDYILDTNTDSIVFTGARPGPDQSFTVDYHYYLSQMGLVTLDREGKINHRLGAPSSNPTPPPMGDQLLVLAIFTLNKGGIDINPSDNRRVTMKDIHGLSERVRRISISNDILKTDLLALKRAKESLPTEILSTFSDSLIDLSKLDLDRSNLSIVPSLLGLTVPTIHKDVPLRYRGGGSVHQQLGTNAFITLPYSNRVLLEQPRATGSRDVNGNESKGRGRMEVSPAFSFLNARSTRVSPCDHISSRMSTIQRLGSESLIGMGLRSAVPNLFQPALYPVIESIRSGDALSNTPIQDQDGYTALLSRRRDISNGEVTIRVRGLTPGLDGHRLYISEREISNYILIGDTSQGQLGIRSSRGGQVQLKFQLPSDLPPGVHTIELKAPNSYSKGRVAIFNNQLNQAVLYSMSAWAPFGEPLSANEDLPSQYPDIEAEILVNRGIDLSTLVTRPLTYEPINQVFRVPYDCYISHVRLRLRSIGLSGKLRVYIRKADIKPSHSIYVVGEANRYEYSNEASGETIFTLEHPVFLKGGEEYSLGLNADSKGFSVFTSILGREDIVSGGIIGMQPLHNGSLWLSRDGLNVEERENELLTYQLDRCHFSGEDSMVYLGTYGIEDAMPEVNQFCLNTRDVIPDGTDITYEYKSLDTWIRFSPNIPVCLALPTKNLEIRAYLSSSNPQVSPKLNVVGSTISLYTHRESGSITSREIEIDRGYSNVEMVIQHSHDPNNNIGIAISDNGGSSWRYLDLEPDYPRVVDPTLSIHESKLSLKNLPVSPLRRKLIYRIELSSSRRGATNPPIVRSVIGYVY